MTMMTVDTNQYYAMQKLFISDALDQYGAGKMLYSNPATGVSMYVMMFDSNLNDTNTPGYFDGTDRDNFINIYGLTWIQKHDLAEYTILMNGSTPIDTTSSVTTTPVTSTSIMSILSGASGALIFVLVVVLMIYLIHRRGR